MSREAQDRLRSHAKKRINICDKCYYIDSEDDGYNFTSGSEWYLCRRYPPNAIRSLDTENGEAWVNYPNVSLNDWCGEFKPEGKQNGKENKC